jgi:ferric-dicitrate binding protein FerR (iron transport regulator)
MTHELAMLIEKCLAGEADEAEIASLHEQIYAAEEVYREYLVQVNFLLDLREISPSQIRRATASALQRSPSRRRPSRSRRPASRSRAPWWIALGLAASLVIGLLLFFSSDSRPPEFLVALLPADAQLLRQGLIVHDDQLYPGDRLITGATAVALHLPGDGTKIIVAKNSRLLVSTKPEFRLDLQQGSFTAEVDPQPKPFRIATPDAQVEIIGTRFSLAYNEQGTRLEVQHGCVEMSSNDQKSKVHGGEALSSRNMSHCIPLAAPPELAILLSMNSPEWRYLDDGADLGTFWKQPNFDDRAWKIGQCSFGYGSGCKTLVAANKITYYFRKNFILDDPSEYQDLILKAHFDDGAIVYLNGIEIARIALPAGIVSAATRAEIHEAQDQTQAPIPAGILKPGRNVIAVEIHNRSIDSRDIFLNLELSAKVRMP